MRARRLPHARTVRTCDALWMELWTVCVRNVGRRDFYQQESHGTHDDSRWRGRPGLRPLLPVSESEEVAKPVRSFPLASGAGTRIHWQGPSPKGRRRGKDGTAERFRSGRGTAGASRVARGNSFPFATARASPWGRARRDEGTASTDPRAGEDRTDGRSGEGPARGQPVRRRRRGGPRRPRYPRPADRRRGTQRCHGAQAPHRARLARSSGQVRQRQGDKGRTSRVTGFGGPRVAAGTPVGGTRMASGGPGPGHACEAGPPEENPGFGCHEAAGGSARAGASVVSDARRARPLRRSSRGVREPIVPPGQRHDRKIAPGASSVSGRQFCVDFGVPGRWCRRPLSGTAGTPSATSEPDVPPGQQRREEVEDFAFLTRFG